MEEAVGGDAKSSSGLMLYMDFISMNRLHTICSLNKANIFVSNQYNHYKEEILWNNTALILIKKYIFDIYQDRLQVTTENRLLSCI